jgi:transcriptional regulator with XRE-family HTH domain
MIGNQIKRLIEENRYSVEVIAKRVGMSKGGFYNSIKNNSFKYETVIAILKSMELTPDVLFEVSGEFNEPAGPYDSSLITKRDLIKLLNEKDKQIEDLIRIANNLSK